MAELIRDVHVMQQMADRCRASGKRIGVVPTMGYLHEGHLSLIREAKKRADVVITTVFVNPKQFGPSEDFSRYPRNLDGDVALATSGGTDIIFAPEAHAVYPDGYLTTIDVAHLDSLQEGKSRPGHFRGVTTVVAKLINITKPHVAVFGQKDAQQAVIIRRMMEDLNFDVEVVVAPIVREADGLAMSSRNSYLTPDQRREAPVLHHALQLAGRMIKEGAIESEAIINEMKQVIDSGSSGSIDYISIADGRTLEEVPRCTVRPLLVSLAVRFGSTRLIDNVTITS
ncbi:MAG: pantoate--beta-alanine ligase [Bacteroidota bacterium]